VEMAFVSPLSRCIDTALAIFGFPSVVRIVITPELRAMEFDQSHRNSLDVRHQGQRYSALKKKYPQKNIVWPQTEEELWWEPHGNFSNLESAATEECVGGTTRVVPSVCDRLARFKDVLLSTYEGVVAVITHDPVALALSGCLHLPVCKPVPLVLGYGGYADMRVSVPMVSCVAVDTLHACEKSHEAVIVIGLLGCPTSLTRRIHDALAAAARNRAPLLIVITEAELIHARAAVASFPWRMTPSDARRIRFDTAARELADLDHVVPAALAALHAGSWSCQVVTSDWAMPRTLLALSRVPSWCLVEIVSTPTTPEDALKLSSEHLREGVRIAQWAMEAPEDWVLVREQCKRELHVVASHMRLWAAQAKDQARTATPGTPFSKHEESSRNELLQLVSALSCAEGNPAEISFSRGHLCELLIAFYDGSVAVAQHPLSPKAGQSTILHLCAAVGAVDHVEDLVSIWGASVEALDSDRRTPLDVVPAGPAGEAVRRLLRAVACGSYFAA